MSRYIEIGGGYSYAALRVGLTIKAPDGREVFVQPGDDRSAIMATIDALDELPDDRRGDIADMALGDYFA